jgi:FAD/FMN-containing dehydrogenase
MKRRDFVLGGLAAPLTAACPPRAPRLRQWSSLQSGLEGDLLLPGSGAFDTARKLYNTRFDHVRPSAVARCKTSGDVRACVDLARRSRMPVHVRSGGHSYAGWSTGPGLVIDVSPMNQVIVDPASGDAVIGAGAKLIDVYDRLAAHGRTLPGGSCPTVGIAGLVLGGGISMLGRAYGMTCDSLLAAEIVTASGEVISCDAERHPDLYWACRGGGGGNFGIATGFRFKTWPLKNITTVRLAWDWPSAQSVIKAWQRWAPSAPDDAWSNCQLRANPRAGRAAVGVLVVFLGEEAGLEPLLADLTAPIGTEPRRTVETHDGLHAMLALAGCPTTSVAECHLSLTSEEGTLARGTYDGKSTFFDRPLSDQAIATLSRQFDLARRRPGLSASVLLDAFGGAIGRIGPEETAFVHRGALFSAQYLANWPEGAKAATAARCQAWLRDFHAAMREHTSGGAYVNYVDPELRDWPRAYYGSNYERLVRVKAAYDPEDFFKLPQGIPVD